jgi:NAD(P)H dehydrogenase (quinone)
MPTKKTLIITAHPSSKGFTHAIAEVIKEQREKIGNEVEILDLYKTNLKQDFLNFENVREIPTDPVQTDIQNKITNASELVFIHPLWWVAPPAILKNFLDQNLTSRFAYRYIDGKRVGLLKGKTASVYITCDGPLLIYMLLGFPFATIWIAGVLVFSGFKVTKFSVTRMLTLKTDEARQKKLEKIKKGANKKSFILSWLSIIGNL